MLSLMNNEELAAAKADVQALIVAAGIEATVLRSSDADRLYGSDDGAFSVVGTVAIDLNEEPKEELSGKIDATASVLPESDLLAEDHLQIDTRRFRVQTVEPAYFFGTITHKTLKLVAIYDR